MQYINFLILLILNILISSCNAYTKNCGKNYNDAQCDQGYCCRLGKCIQEKVYDTKANILFALDNSWSMLADDRLIKLNDGLKTLADYMPDQAEMYYTVFSSSATDVKSFTKENIPEIVDDEESHGTGFSAVFNTAKNFFELQNKEKNNILILVTDGIPEYTESEENDFQAMANAIAAASDLKNNNNVKIYVFNVNQLCNVNEPMTDRETKIEAPCGNNPQSNNSIMKLISSNYSNVISSYADGKDGLNIGINIVNYNEIQNGDKYYNCPGNNNEDWSNIFTNIISEDYIDN
eukprot:jgi/Orpsp1_1/1187224/evm.model.d7180000056179.1